MRENRAVIRIVIVLRWICGVFYAATGLIAVFHLVQMPEGTTPEAIAFFSALHASGFMLPLLVFCFIAGGLLLLSDRTTPLGLILLAPPVVVIPLYNTFLERQPWTSGPWVVAFELFLAWYYWSRFTPLWSGNAASAAQRTAP